jgi:tripartite-type tricarboxylate transporter receptor subunit TctC
MLPKAAGMHAGIAAILLAAAIAGSFAPHAVAQGAPGGVMRIIVPYGAGGVTDSLARVVGERLAEALGTPVIVENRPGASSMLGMQACASAPPNGQTVCITVPDSLSYNPQVFANLPYDPDKSFAPVIRLAWTNNLLVAHAKSPFNSYAEMIAYAKTNPGKLNWGTWGPATLPDVYLRWIAAQAGVTIQAIPYKGGATQVNPAVYAGEVDITYMGFGTAAPQIAAGAIKPIVAVGPRRLSFMPDLPSLAEVGVDPGLQSYFGAFAPAETPQPVVARLNAAFAAAIATPQVQTFYKTTTLVAEANTPEEFAAFVTADRAAAAKVFRSIGISPQAAPQ